MTSPARQGVFLLFTALATGALGLVYSVVVGRRLGPAEYADFAAAMALISLCYSLLASVNATITRFTSLLLVHGQSGTVRGLRRVAAKKILAVSVPVLLAGTVLVRPLQSLLAFRSPLVLLSVLGVLFFLAQLTVPQAILRGLQKFTHYNINILFESIVRLVAGLGILLFAYSASSAVIAFMISAALAFLLGWHQTNRLLPSDDTPIIRQEGIGRHTFWMFLVSFGAISFQNVDLLFVKANFDQISTGQYGAATTLARILGLIATPFATLALPHLTSHLQARNGAFRALWRICGLFLGFSLIPSVILFLQPRLALGVFGGSFSSDVAVSALPPLAAAALVGGLMGIILMFFAAAARFRFLWILLGGLVVEIVLLAVYGESVFLVAMITLFVKSITLALLLAFLLSTRRSYDAVYNSGRAGEETRMIG